MEIKRGVHFNLFFLKSIPKTFQRGFCQAPSVMKCWAIGLTLQTSIHWEGRKVWSKFRHSTLATLTTTVFASLAFFCLAELCLFPNSSNFDLWCSKPWFSKTDCSFILLALFLWPNILVLGLALCFWSKPSNLTFIPDHELDPECDHLDHHSITSMCINASINACIIATTWTQTTAS